MSMQYHVTRMKCAITIWAIVALSMWNLSAQVPNAPYQPDAFTSLLLHFDEGKGNTARDASEFANHCIVGNVRWTKGRFGMALDFRGGGYAYVRLSPSLDVREKLTIEAWIWIDGPSDEIQRVAFRSGVYGLYISARRLTLTFFVNAGQRAWESVNAPIPAKRWVHIAGVYDGKEMRLFVDGELAGRREKSGPIVESPAPLFIGANDATGRWRLHGMIDEVRISHIARTKFDPQERLTLVTTAEFKPLPPERVKITLLLPTIGIRTCRQPPAIDGNLNDPAWRRAVRIRLRDHPFGKYLTQRTHVYVTRDADNLYVAFRCIERRMDALVAKCKVRDGDVFSDDCIELFLQPDPQVGEYFHIAVNPLGTVYDARCAPRPDKSWDSNVRVGVKKGDREWCVELAIPYRALGVSAVNEGDEWRGNFCREEKPHGELSAWAPVGGRFHQPNKFGRLKFTDKPLPPPAERVVTIRGILRDERGNRAVGVRVVTPFGEARTDALGYFTLRGMIRGRNMIAFKHPRYEPLGGIVIAKRDIEVIAPPALKFVNPYRYEFTLPSTAHGYRVYSINYLDDLDPAERPDDSHYEAPL
ncbi:MAG TPA: hypothetical protein EYP10_13890, partial [Armatimonadetes bacterium]|nr:hypothetical protein [Armatimonadota bacterium]